MSFDTEGLLDLWTRRHPSPTEAADAFRQLYTDPVRVNGAMLTADDLVQRAVSLQDALDDVHREVLEVCDAGSQVAIAFRLSGRHVGPLGTSAGVLAPTGQHLSLRVIDILTLTDGRISAITMVADELGALAPVHAVALVQPAHAAPQFAS
jgi:ketosteroid isomerase-like protein